MYVCLHTNIEHRTSEAHSIQKWHIKLSYAAKIDRSFDRLNLIHKTVILVVLSISANSTAALGPWCKFVLWSPFTFSTFSHRQRHNSHHYALGAPIKPTTSPHNFIWSVWLPYGVETAQWPKTYFKNIGLLSCWFGLAEITYYIEWSQLYVPLQYVGNVAHLLWRASIVKWVFD